MRRPIRVQVQAWRVAVCFLGVPTNESRYTMTLMRLQMITPVPDLHKESDLPLPGATVGGVIRQCRGRD